MPKLDPFAPQGVLYARVVHRGDEPAPFRGPYQPFEDLQTLIQYWIFYGYDKWQTETVVGRMTQEHEADWEHVSVGLDSKNTPLFVALSAHCGGQTVDWKDVHAAPGRPDSTGKKVEVFDSRKRVNEDVSHPIVAVARGSHANYAASAGPKSTPGQTTRPPAARSNGSTKR